jgi:phytoene dehydrogenase-like protein
MTAASPFIQSQHLEKYGLRWCYPEIDLAHPLDDGHAAVLLTSINDTIEGFDDHDARTWRRLFGPLATHFDELVSDVFRPLAHFPDIRAC